MDFELQRERLYPRRQNRRRNVRRSRVGKENVYDRLTKYLGPDERLILPETYVDNTLMYDKICGVVYLVKGLHEDAPLEWVWENNLGKVMDRRPARVMLKALIVRVRLPWNEVEWEWLTSEQELLENFEDYEVLDVMLTGIDHKNPGKGEHFLNRGVYEANTERFEITKREFLVSWKTSPEYVKRLLGIRKDDLNTYLAE